MRAKSLGLLVLALGCGLVASIGITQVMAKRGSGPATPEDTVPVFVAIENIPYNTPLSPQLLKLEPWPKDKVPPGALTQIEEIEGRYGKSTIYAGMPILASTLSDTSADNTVSRRIPAGYTVVGVKVDSVSSLHGLIRPEDRVNVSVFLKGGTDSVPRVKAVLQNIRVFAVNSDTGEEEEGEAPTLAQTISLLVKPKQAAKLMLATEVGKIRLSLRHPTDDSSNDVAINESDLFETVETGDRDREKAPSEDVGANSNVLDFLESNAEAADAPAERPTVEAKDVFVMQVISGADVEVVELEKAQGDDESDTQGFSLWKAAKWFSSNRGEGEEEPSTEPAEEEETEETADAEDESDDESDDDNTIEMDLSQGLKLGQGS